VTLTLTSDDLESHIFVNVSSTLGLWLHWVWLWTYRHVRTDGWTDIFTGFIRSSLRRWPKNVSTTVCATDVTLLHRHTYKK